MREKLIEKLKENEDFKEASVDEILRILIDDTDLLEVVACLDMIAIKKGTRVSAFDWSGMIYPSGPSANIKIPDPPWKLTDSKVQKLINEDQQIKVIAPANQPDDPQEKNDPDNMPDKTKNSNGDF
jgi:hypothetical protein